MAQEADDPISQARQGANWLVGLSGAAIGGALAKLDWILKFPPAGKKAFLVAAFFFFLSILAGMFYAFQLFALKQRKLKLDEEKGKQAPTQTAIDAAEARLKEANQKVARFHIGTMVTFALAGAATLVCLGFVLNAPPPPKPAVAAVPNHYVLNHVLVHTGGRLSHSHTFLVDQQTGELWLMTCRADKTVEFRRVQKRKLDGTPEEVVVNAKPGEK
jgi:hypothetical protein